MSQAETIANLETAVRKISDTIRALDEGMLLAPLGNWSPRGILAHLIGWNEHHIRGNDQILKGEEPFYESEHDANYLKVNAEHAERISSTDQEELLQHLANATKTLAEYIGAVPAEDYGRDFGSRFRMGFEDEEVMTVKSIMEETVEDINHHRVQIEDWAKAQRA